MRQFLGILSLCVAALLWAGCASTKKIDWQSRVGNYTYDQAVIELGPPDKYARLSDGSSVAEWYYGRGGGLSVGVGTGVYTGPVGVGVGVPVTPRGARVLRLNFGPDGVLQGWRR